MKKFLFAINAIAVLLCGSACVGDVVINEFMAANGNVVTDAAGVYSDWIELHNPSFSDVSLSGWYLTDDPNDLTKWQFPPAVILSDGDYLLVWADASPQSWVSGELHANFKLGADGEYLALVHSNGFSVVHEFAPQFPAQFPNISYGVGPTNDLRYFTNATPAAANSVGAHEFVADTKFSVTRGYFTNHFQLEITSATPGAEIYYTTNGDEPTPALGTLYLGPITITETTALLARGYKSDFYPTDVDAQTYIFLEDVINQPDNPAGFPDRWMGATTGGDRDGNYEMDPRIVSNVLYSASIKQAMQTHPVVSLIIDVEDMFETGGIYANSTAHGDAWERSVSAEFFGFPHGKEEQINCGLRMNGNASRSINRFKHNMRLAFRSQYGESRLTFDVFDNPAGGRYDTIVLRGGNGDSWINPGVIQTAQYLRDQWQRDMQIAMGQETCDQGYVHLYINGLYWGLYHAIERMDNDMASAHFGGDKARYDAVKGGGGEGLAAISGSLDEWNTVVGLANAGLDTESAYTNLLSYIDPENLIDYILLNFYIANDDWDSNNFRAAKMRSPGSGRFRFFSWDGERTDLNALGGASRVVTVDSTSRNVNTRATRVHQQATANTEYRMLFADRVHKHFFNDGALTPGKVTERWVARANEIRLALVAESARWGDTHSPSDPLTPDDPWEANVSRSTNYWFPARTGIMLSQYRGIGLYPSLEAPVFHIDGDYQYGGVFSNGATLSMTTTNTIYYTLDGSDPREYGTGVNVGLVYTSGIGLEHNVQVKARARSTSGEWSALNEAVFLVEEHPALRVSEIMYAPRDPSGVETNGGYIATDFEFIELHNTGSGTLGLAGITFTDAITFDFLESTVSTIAPGDYIIIVKNLAAFSLRYDTQGMAIAGEYQRVFDFPLQTLADDGERVRLQDGHGSNLVSFSYGDGRGWPHAADGVGHSLVPRVVGSQDDGLLDYGGNWRASAVVDGSPGGPDPDPVQDVVINEVAAHTDTELPPPNDSDDWIELYNPSGVPVDISGWTLSDDGDALTRYVFPTGSVIAAGGFLTVSESTHFHTNRTDGSGFGLNKAGETIYLARNTAAGTQIVDVVAFKGQANGPTLGRYPDGADYWYTLSATANAPNAAPQLHVLISELMVSPFVASNAPAAATTHEYVEIYNPLGVPVDLWTDAGAWRLDGGIGYVFPTNTTLQSSEYVVVVSFDPLDSIARTDFLDSYGLTNGQVRLFGPYDGRLDNRTERVAIECPQEADGPGESVSWIIVDEVIYFVHSPWPSGIDGTGASLQRSVSPFSGRDPGNWFAALEGTPGVPGTLLAIASPASGSRYFAPDTVAVNVFVEAQQVSNSVVQVEILEGTNVLCVVTQAPYRCTLLLDEARTYFLRATMTDGAGVHTSRVAIVDGLQIEAYAATNVRDVAAICAGALIGSGEANAALYWGDEDGGQDALSWDHVVPLTASGGSPIHVQVGGLTAGRTYYYRFRAQVEDRFAWSTNTVVFRATTLDSWSHKLAVEFPWAPASALHDFPVLIKLHEGISGFSYAQFASTVGNDLRVGDGVSGEPLRYEIEHWNTGGVSYVWVQVPALTSNSSVNAHWGYSPAAGSAPPYASDGRIWRDDYAAVWHLNESLSDAARYQFDAESVGSISADGVVAGGRLFDGVDDVMHQGPGASWYSQHMQDMTISVWAHPTAVGGVPFGAAVGGDITQDFGFWLNAHPFVRNLFVNIDGAVTQFGQFNLNEWCLLTLTVSNGVLFAAKNDLAPVQVGPVGAFLPTRQPTLGNLAGGDDPFTGRLDELRVSTTTRSAAWIRATYRTVAEHDAFTSYGTVVSGGPFVDADGNGLPDAWEVRHFGTAGIDEQGHGDADPMDNLSEYVAGTDPTNSADFFWLGIETGAVNPVFYFNTRLTAGEGYEGLDRFYALEDRAIMSTGVWSHLPGADRIPATGTTFVYSNAVPATNTLRQYRSKVWLEDTP